MREVVDYVNESEKTELRAVSEQDYYRGYAESFRTFALIGGVMALVITLGGIMVGMNTMYTAVMGRIREIGTLQIIGFSKRAVLVGIITESVIIALVSGAIGCGLGYLANGLPMKIPMAAFRVNVSAQVILLAMGASLLIGLVGAFIPASRALRLRMVDAVRHQ